MQAIPLYQSVIAPGRVVKLDDGRIGIVDCVRPSPCCEACGSKQDIDRAYVVGIEKEFAAWVLITEVVRVYGVLEPAAVSASFAPAPIA
jgi:hypothetical protein